MKRFKQTVVLLLTRLVLAAVLMSASAQADPPAPVGPEPLLPCTRFARDTPSDADPAAAKTWRAAIRCWSSRTLCRYTPEFRGECKGCQ